MPDGLGMMAASLASRLLPMRAATASRCSGVSLASFSLMFVIKPLNAAAHGVRDRQPHAGMVQQSGCM